MSVKPTSLLGGESVYCINQKQLDEAVRLSQNDPEAAPRLQKAVAEIESKLSRNERAALAFVLIERLRTSKD
jgi:hypothetical protein